MMVLSARLHSWGPHPSAGVAENDAQQSDPPPIPAQCHGRRHRRWPGWREAGRGRRRSATRASGRPTRLGLADTRCRPEAESFDARRTVLRVSPEQRRGLRNVPRGLGQASSSCARATSVPGSAPRWPRRALRDGARGSWSVSAPIAAESDRRTARSEDIAQLAHVPRPRIACRADARGRRAISGAARSHGRAASETARPGSRRRRRAPGAGPA
jgi:hypothetical protein